MPDLPINTTLLNPEIFPSAGGPPHAAFDARRESDPVHWNPIDSAYAPPVRGFSMQTGYWVLTRYQNVSDVSRDPEQFSAFDEGFLVWDLYAELLEQQRANFVGMRPAEYAPVKRSLIAPFSPKGIDAIAPEVNRLAKQVVDEFAATGSCKFACDVASKLPVYTLCELMGIPAEQRKRVVDLGNALADLATHGQQSDDALTELFGIAHVLAEQKRRQPDGSLMSLLIHDKALALDPMRINMFFVVFAIAGHETTRSAAAHFMYLMSRHPDQYAILRSDIDRYLPNTIEEVLRYASPTTNFRRTATVDAVIGGTRVRKGDRIYLSYPAANRDPTVFPNPHAFDITRENARKHLAFGTGPHVCLGARLACLELHVLLKQVVTRLTDFRIVGEVQRLRSIWFNAITHLTVRFTPECDLIPLIPLKELPE